jgi:hypothetical protein
MGNEVVRRLGSLGIDEVLTAPQSPSLNGYAERLIGSVRRECLNHFIILNASHLKRTLASYFPTTTNLVHISLSANNARLRGQVMKDGAIVVIAELGGLHHGYERVAA